MEDDAELEDEEGRHLRAEALRLVVVALVAEVVDAAGRVGDLVVADGVGGRGCRDVGVGLWVFVGGGGGGGVGGDGGDCGGGGGGLSVAICLGGVLAVGVGVGVGVRGGARGHGDDGDAVFDVGVVGVRVPAEDVEAGGHQLDEEHDEDGHQGDALDPGVFGDGALQTWVSERVACWGEELRMSVWSCWSGRELTWMKAVAMMTPEPKYLVMKKAILGMCMFFERAAKTGRRAPGCVSGLTLRLDGDEEEMGSYQALIRIQ